MRLFALAEEAFRIRRATATTTVVSLVFCAMSRKTCVSLLSEYHVTVIPMGVLTPCLAGGSKSATA